MGASGKIINYVKFNSHSNKLNQSQLWIPLVNLRSSVTFLYSGLVLEIFVSIPTVKMNPVHVIFFGRK